MIYHNASSNFFSSLINLPLGEIRGDWRVSICFSWRLIGPSGRVEPALEIYHSKHKEGRRDPSPVKSTFGNTKGF